MIGASGAGERRVIPSRFKWLLDAAEKARRAASNDLVSAGERRDCAEIARYLEEQVKFFGQIYGESAKMTAKQLSDDA